MSRNYAPEEFEASPANGEPGVGAQGPGVPLFDKYWYAFLKHKWLGLGIIGGALIIGLLATLLTTPIYSAHSRIEISRLQDNVTDVEGVENAAAGESLEFYQTQYSLLESKSLAQRVARTLNLPNDQAFLTAFDLSGEDSGSVAAAGDAPLEDRIVETLLDNVSISPIRGSSLVDVGFSSPDPQLSARIANTWTEQFIQANLDRRYESTEEARTFLEEQLETLREQLEQSESDLVAYASDKRIIALSTEENSEGNTRTERTLAASNLEQLNSELAAATAARIQAQSALGASGGVSEGSLSNTAINGLRQERAEAQAELAEVLSRFEPGYPAAQALRSQVESLDAAIAREEARVRDSVRTRYQEASARESELQQRVNALEQQLIDERRDSIQYTIYQRDVDTNRQLYEALLQRYREIGVAGVGSNNVLIVDRAEAPQDPSSPNLPLNLAISLLLGTVAAIAVIAAIEYADQSIKNPADVSDRLGIPLLGSVPMLKSGKLVEALEDKKSATNEAYLSIRTSLSFLTNQGIPSSFMLTSTEKNEGKSISSLALAQLIGRTGSRVVLVDSDMRNPSIGNLLEQRYNDGLSNVLSGLAEWRKVVHPTEQENLSFIDAGPAPPNAAELLSGSSMSDLIAELLTEFDHVVVDGPPVLGLADAPILSSHVEGVIYTIEANRLKVRGIQASLARMRAANAHILGGIVTKLDQKDAIYGYGYAYEYGYGERAQLEQPASAVA